MSNLYHIMYTPRRTKLQFKIIFEEDPLLIACAQQYHIHIIQIFIYIFLRESSRKMCSKTHQIAQLTRNLGSMLQYPYAPIPLNIVCAVIHYLLFVYKKMNIFTNIFFYKILAKYSPKRTKLHHFKKIFSGGEHVPTFPKIL